MCSKFYSPTEQTNRNCCGDGRGVSILNHTSGWEVLVILCRDGHCPVPHPLVPDEQQRPLCEVDGENRYFRSSMTGFRSLLPGTFKKCYTHLFNYVSVCTHAHARLHSCMHKCAHVLWPPCGGGRLMCSWFSPSILWFLGIQLRSSGLEALLPAEPPQSPQCSYLVTFVRGDRDQVTATGRTNSQHTQVQWK